MSGHPRIRQKLPIRIWWYAIAGALLFVAPTAVHWGVSDLVRALVQATVIAPLLLAICALGVAAGPRVGAAFASPTGEQLARSVIVGVPVALALVVVDVLATLVAYGDVSRTGLQNFMANFGLDPRFTTGYLVAAVGAGFVEELVFRLVLLTAIAWVIVRITGRRRASLVAATLTSALLFGAAHGFTPLALAFHVPSGLAYGSIYARRGIESAILTHVSVNVGIYMLATAVAPLFV